MTPEEMKRFEEHETKEREWNRHIEKRLDEIPTTIEGVIATTVNGKLDKQHSILERQNEVMHGMVTKLDNHILEHKKDVDEFKTLLDDITPIIKAYQGSKILGEFLKWFAGVGIAYLVITGWLRP